MTVSLSACQPSSGDVDVAALDERASEIASAFVNTLQPTLQQAMASGGPVEAIDVCAEQAPRIAADLASDSGWEVSRVSLRPRNVTSATPDDWERSVLEQFDQRQQEGEPGGGIRTSEVVNGTFRYMQAQPAGPLCLTCHGDSISEDVRSALAEHYPEDMATGYSAGEIRGAISLGKPL
ncbi:MAG: Tll0287-like domain-containing protein [Pseudomonadota bacterium]